MIIKEIVIEKNIRKRINIFYIKNKKTIKASLKLGF